MDPQVQASFIPKRSLDVAPRAPGGTALILIIALLIFITSLVAAGASFLYQQYLQKSLADKKHSLALNEAAFSPASIEELLRTDQRINQAQTLMSKHIAVTSIFYYLSEQTLTKVAFAKFSYDLKADGSATIQLTGIAQDFSTLALQSDQFGASKYLKNIVFTGIGVDEAGRVAFSVSADVDASLLNYATSLKSGGTVTIPPTQPVASSTPIGTSTGTPL